MSNISTISEFLLHANSQYKIFDMSRGIQELSAQQFLDIENGLRPYPSPRLGAAWLGVLFWHTESGQNAMANGTRPQYFIWFLKFSLDEQSKLIPGPRDHFLRILLDALAKEAKGEPPEELPDHPYSFTPPQLQMAAFHSIVNKQLALKPSDYFDQAMNYLLDPQQQDWSGVPLQGISDVAAAMDDATVHALLLKNFRLLSDEVAYRLCEAMEHHVPPRAISTLILEWVAQSSTPQARVAGLRALSRSEQHDELRSLLRTQLCQPELSSDILVTISGRHWHRLTDHSLFNAYMETLAGQAPDLFSAVFADLVRIPALRTQMLTLLRSPEKSQTLLKAIGRLFSEQGR